MRAFRTYQGHSGATMPARRRPYGRHNDAEAYSAPNPWRDEAQGVHDAAEWKAALISAGHGTREVDMKLVKTLRRRIWVQTRHAIDLSLAGRLWPGVLSRCPSPWRTFRRRVDISQGEARGAQAGRSCGCSSICTRRLQSGGLEYGICPLPWRWCSTGGWSAGRGSAQAN